MKSYFRIDEPTVLQFSGGRTSGYMVARVLEENGGIPEGSRVVFCNTGKEHPATLEFVRDVGRYWGVHIDWLEYRADGDGFARVEFETAARNGEPFAALVEARKFLPNPVARFCTSELKVRTTHRFLRSVGFGGGDGWLSMLGIRADEPRRAARVIARPNPESAEESLSVPLFHEGVSVRDVAEFWRAQPFDLGLYNENGIARLGNCDLCFMKPAAQVLSIVRAEPDRVEWWAQQEKRVAGLTSGDGGFFRNDRPSYSQMAAFAASQGELFEDSESFLGCFCGD